MELLGLDRQGLSKPARRLLYMPLPAACHLQATEPACGPPNSAPGLAWQGTARSTGAGGAQHTRDFVCPAATAATAPRPKPRTRTRCRLWAGHSLECLALRAAHRFSFICARSIVGNSAHDIFDQVHATPMG